jgi:DNA-binding response OmpR family regulator
MPRILVIEDNDAVRHMVRRVLVDEGYEVQEAADGRAGLNAYREQPSDLVITDIVMPDTEGLETIRELCRQYPSVKIIAMSSAGGGGPAGYLQLALKFGAGRILTKPFTHDELRAAVVEVLASDVGGKR